MEIKMDNKYIVALDKAISWIELNYSPIGIIVSGSIIRGNPNAQSDFDIFVIHREEYRQRVQKYFNNIPCEIFINPFNKVIDYLDVDYKNNRPITAHMIASGYVIRGADNIEIINLINLAKEYLCKKPLFQEKKLLFIKYGIVNLFEDATDVKDTDEILALYIINRVVLESIDYIYLLNLHPLPRLKERIANLQSIDTFLYNQIIEYYSQSDFYSKYISCEKLVKRLLSYCTICLNESLLYLTLLLLL